MSYWCGGGRIAELFPAPAGDTWWKLEDGEPPGPLAGSVVQAVVRYAVPAILAGLEELDRVTDPSMYDAQGQGPGRDPDGGGAEPAATFVQPLGTSADRHFAEFASDRPSDRLYAAYATARVPDDPRTLPALLDRLEHDPNPVVRKLVASRVLITHGGDAQVTEALGRTAGRDPHPGVRWAGATPSAYSRPSRANEIVRPGHGPRVRPCWAAFGRRA